MNSSDTHTPPNAGENFARACSQYEDGDYAGAAALFGALLRGAPDDATLLRLTGLALTRAGHVHKALPLLARARQLNFTDPLTHLHYGIALLHAGRPARAAALFRRTTILSPDSAAAWINFSTALVALGQPRAARAAAARALARAPGDADTMYALGQAEAACGNHAGARAAFLGAAAARPSFADAWVNAGICCYRQSDVTGAIRAMHRALQAVPGNGAAAANLAALELLRGETDTALDRLEAVLARDPGCVPALINLANARLLDRKPDAALAVLTGAPPDGRDGAHWRAHRAMALLHLGRTQDARAELAAIGDPYDAEILVVSRRLTLAEWDGDEAAVGALAERLAQLAEDPAAALLEHRITSRFELARFHDRHHRTEAAFAHWHGGHRLLSAMQPFSRDAHAAFIDASIAVFDRARLHQGPRANALDPAPVFIVGMPRSGTTLTEQILGAHPLVFPAGERAAIHTLQRRLHPDNDEAGMARALAALDPVALTLEAGAFLAELHALAPEARCILDKMPANARHLGFIATLLPGARVIHCRRDPRDIGLSIYQRRFFGYHPYAHDLGDLGWTIVQHERLMAHWRGVLPLPILDLHLADWVADFRGTLDRVLAFLDLPYNAACESFHRQDRLVRTASAAQVREPVNARGIGRWRRYETELGPLIAGLMAGGLIDL